MIHLYAFAPADAPLPALAGIGQGELEACTFADIAAVVSSLDATELGRDAVIAHGRVVEALRETATAVLPVRFGERFVDRVALRDAVGERPATLRESLRRVRGCAEFGVRMVAADERKPAPAANGSEYMRARLTEFERAEAVAAELHGPLSRCARAAIVSPGADHAAAYLVRNEERAAFERALAGFTSAHPEITVVCTGPWAPYSFAEAK